MAWDVPGEPPLDEQHILTRVKAGAQAYLGAESMQRLTLTTREDYIADRLVAQLRTAVLAEHLPPQQVTVEVDYDHPAAGGRGVTTDPRFATWWDMFKATYRARWWMRWRSWPVRTVDTPVRYLHTEPVRCRHLVSVSLLDHWLYPQCDRVLPGEEYGAAVLHVGHDGRAEPLPWT